MKKAAKKTKTPRVVKKVRVAKTVRVHKIRLAKSEVVRVVAHKDVAPLVVHKEPGVIEIIPAPKEVTTSWWSSFFR